MQDIYITHELQEMTPDAICDAFPPVTLAQVHAALAYYFDHMDEIRAEVEAGKAFAEEYRKQHPDRVR